MANVRMPNGDVVRFPDAMSREEIAGLIEKKFPTARREAQAANGSKPYDNAGQVALKAAQNLGPSIAGSINSTIVMGAEGVKDALAEPAPDNTLRFDDAAEAAKWIKDGAQGATAVGGDAIMGPAGAVAGAAIKGVAAATGTTEALGAGADAVIAKQTEMRAKHDAQLEANAPDARPNSLESYLYDVTFAGLDMAAPMALSVLVRNPAPMAAYGGMRSSAEGYKKARDAGLPPAEARFAAGLYGASEAVGELVGTKLLLDGGKTLIGSIVRGAITESISEAATEALSVMIDAGIIGEDMTLEDAMKRIGYAGAVAAPLGGGFGGVGHATRPKEPGEVIDVVNPQTEPKDDDLPVPEQILALPKPGTILALPAPDAPTDILRRHPQLPGEDNSIQVKAGENGQFRAGTQNADGTFSSAQLDADVRDQQARIALQQGKRTETRELLALARETITPIGAFTAEELGPQLVGKIKAQRVRTGRPIDAPITMTDLVNAKVPQAEIDAMLAWKRPRTSSELLTPSDVKAAANAKKLALDSAFSELALRTTGARNVDQMSQTQLHTLLTALEGLPAQAETTSIPIANLPGFTESQYDAAVTATRKKGRYTFDTVKDAASTKNSKVAAEIRDAMVRRGQLVHRGGSDYRLYDVTGAEKQATADDVPKGAFSEYTVKKMPVRQVRIKQNGKSLGTFDSATAARDKIRTLREAEGKAGTKPSQLEITHDADAEAYAVLENRYDEEGRLLGQVPVNTSRDRAAAERMAEDMRSPPTALPAEATTPVTTKLGYRSNTLREGLQGQERAAQAEAKAQRKPVAPIGLRGREAEVLKRVQDHVTSRALPLLGVKTKLVEKVTRPDGRVAYGSHFDKLITLTAGHFQPGDSIEVITDNLAQTIDHELIHALVEANVLQRDSASWNALVKFVTKARRPIGGEGAGDTYLAYAEANYPGLSQDALLEEAVAEAFRVWAANKRNVVGPPAGIFRQLVQWFRELLSAIPTDVFNAIATGDMVRAALVPPGSLLPRAISNRQMAEASAKAKATTVEPEVQTYSRAFIRARQQARDDRFGRSGPKTVIGTDPSRAYDTGDIGPREWVATKVADYQTKRGMKSPNLGTYLSEPMAFLRQVADAQEKAKHSPLRVDVLRAYNALKSETKIMFETLGLRVEPWESDGQPYASPAEMHADMARGRVKLRLTDALFGQGPDNERHPMLQPSGFNATDGKPLSFNDIFRVVHDVYGHGQSGFRSNAQGDYNAYHEHARLVSPESRPALAVETLGQSAWHHYGPHLRRTDGTIPRDGDLDYLPSDQKEWAEQKAFLLPETLLDSDPGIAIAAAADQVQPTEKFMVGSPAFQAWFGDSKVVDANGNPQRVYHGTWRGDFDAFDTARSELGSHFGTIEQASEIVEQFIAVKQKQAHGVHVYPTYLSIKKPLRLIDRGSFDLRDIADQLREQGFSPKIHNRLWHFNATRKDNTKAQAALKAAGYDGVVYLNRREAIDGPMDDGGFALLDQLTDEEFLARYPDAKDSWVAFDPGQVKSAVANEGQYDPANPNIRYAVGNRKLEDLIAANTGLKGVLKYLTPDEQAKVKSRNAAELVELFTTLPAPAEMAAVAYSARAKRGWYEKSAEALVRIFGVNDAPRFAALLAATSPQTSVESNSVNALQMWTGWIRAGRPTDREGIMAVMAENVIGAKGIESVLPAWINNSVTALSSPDPSAIVLSGPKVNSFMLNLRGVVDEVTNDAWMANYALVDQTLFRKTGPTPGKGVGYLAMNAAVRKAAASATRLTGERWTPEQIQETIWSWAKTLYEKANTTTSAQDILAAGQLTHEEISTTPDFASLFVGGVYRNILEKGGYADVLATLPGGNRPDGGNGLRGDVRSAEGSGVTQSAFDRHLRRAARRLDALRTQRSELASSQAVGGVDGLRPRAVRSGLPNGAEWAFEDGRNVTETKDRMDFLEKLRAAKATHGPVGLQVAEAPGARMFLFDEGRSGFSLDGDNIVAVFSTVGGPSNVVGRVMDLALQEGGRRLDGFDTFLPKLYARHGFKAVARMPFSEEFAPEGWDYAAMAAFNKGKPDVVFMAYDPASANADTDVVVADYDAGEAAQRRALQPGDLTKYMVGPADPAYGRPRSPGGALSAPSVTPAPFTETRDGNKWFAGGTAEAQLRQARDGIDGAVLTYMSTEEFLLLTSGEDPEQAVYDAAADEGLRFNTIPSLVVDGHAGIVRVVDHDGRYAAHALSNRISHLPVVLYPKSKSELGLVTALEPTKEARDGRTTDDTQGRRRGRGDRQEAPAGTLRPLQRLPGLPARSPGPNARIVAAADAYLNSMGLPHRRQAYHVVADPVRGKRIADAYDQMKHAPQDPEVVAAYRAMIDEVKAQYQAAIEAGLKVEIIRGEDPYPEGPKQVLEDLLHNNHLWVYPTDSGFGSINDITDNPLLEPTDFMVEGHQMLANDLFRVVHDYFGHGLEGAGFGPSGEENAWQAHMRMFSPSAQLAMTSETRGQNSWVNFGPYGEQNRDNQRETVYADQKVGILPSWAINEGVVDDAPDVPWEVAITPGNLVPMKPRAENYPADRQQGGPKYSVTAAFGQKAPLHGAPASRNIVRQRNDGVIGKFIASVGRSKRPLIAGASVFDIRVKLQDRMLPLKEMIEELQDAGGLVDDTNHAYMREQLFHGRVQDQLGKREKTVYQPLFDALREAVAKDGITIAGFEDYLYAKHAPERNAYLRARGSKLDSPSGMSDADAIAIIDKAAAKGQRVKLEQLARLAYAITADTTRTRNESGLLSDEAASSSPFRFYVPLKGFAEEDLDPELNGDPEGLKARTGRGFSIGGKEDRSMTGRDRKAGDLLGHLLLQNTESVIRAEKNIVALSFMRLLKENPGRGYGEILESKPTRRVVGPNGMIRDAGDPNYKVDPTIVTAKYKGGEIVARVEPRVARAMRGDGVAGMSTFVKGLAWMNRYLAMVNTSLNPEFLISNLARDLQTSGILAQQYDVKGLSGSITKAVPAAMKGILAVQRKGDAATGEWAQAYRDMQEDGGTIEFMGINDIDTMVGKIRRGVATAGSTPTPRQVLNQVQNIFGLIGDVNAAVENSLRLGAYVAARKSGVSRPQAAYLAKNLTVNFNKGGEMKTAANALYLFYNAATQGSAVLIQGLKNKKVQKLAAAVVGLGFVMDMVNRALLGGGDDEDGNGVGDYDEIPDYVTERNLIIMLPGSRNYVAIPMPYGFNAFYNTGRNLSNMFSGSPVHSPGKSAVSIMMGGLNAFNPLGGSNSIVNFLAPTFLDPIFDLVGNTDFTGRNIVPDRMDQNGVPTPDSQKFWNTTNPAYKWTAEQLNALTGGDAVTKGLIDYSPEVFEYWTDYALGGAGKFLIRSGTATAQTLTGNWQDVETDDVPFARKVVGTVTNRGNTELYYNNAQDIMTLKARLDMYGETGQADALRATLDGNRSRLPLIGLFEKVGKDLTALRKQVRAVREAPLPEARRREMIENLQAQMDQVMAIANGRYYELIK